MTSRGDTAAVPSPLPADLLAMQVAALRSQGAAQHDPQRWGFIEALAQRSQRHDGAVRALLDLRLARALTDFQAGGRPDQRSTPGAAPTRHARSTSSALTELLQALGAQPDAAPSGHPSLRADGDNAAGSAPPTDLKALRYFRSSWAQLSVAQRVQQSQDKLPAHAGPLNSHALALRALMLMQDVAPSYVTQWVGYVDSLLWLDQAQLRATAPAAMGRPSRAKGRA